ncbi:MAG: sugar transferase [Planctomycetota bacterium]
MVFKQLLPRLASSWAGSTRRKRSIDSPVLSPDAFERAAMGERMRVDRNGSILAILLVRLGEASSGPDAVDYLGRVLQDRLRLTDTVGVLRDGRLAILLPDTPRDGAWKVADDVQELVGGGGVGPEFEILMYPERSTDDSWSEDSIHEPEPGDAEQPVAGLSAVQHSALQNGALQNARLANAAIDPVEAIFVQPLPLWKRSIDLVAGCVGLAIATPVIGVSAAAVALTSPGGAFFKQSREGLGGRRFNIYKIRTMRVDAEAQKEALREHSEQDGPAFKMTVDPRVTRVGRLLRALSIDELPQLLNVVRGEMSLVGPRPLPIEESQQCQPWQRRRLHVTPGITCIWQVRGRNIVPFDEWIRMDLQYARVRSPWSDLKLLAETAPALIMSKGPR